MTEDETLLKNLKDKEDMETFSKYFEDKLTPEQKEKLTRSMMKLIEPVQNLMAGLPPSKDWERLTGLTIKQLDELSLIEGAALIRAAAEKEKPISKKKQAEENGAITAFPEYIALITDKDRAGAFQFSNGNNKCYIEKLETDFINNMVFDEDTGKIYFKNNRLDNLNIRDFDETNKSLKDIDIPLLMAIYTAIYCNYEWLGRDTLDIYLPTFTNKLGVNARGDNLQAVLNKISEFTNLIGVFPDGSYYKVLDFVGYNPETKILTLLTPYMNRLMFMITGESEPYKLSKHDVLVHSIITNEKDKIAVQIVTQIIATLRQRGQTSPTKEDRETYKEKIATIESNQAIRRALEKELSDCTQEEQKAKEKEYTLIYEKEKSVAEMILIKTTTIKMKFQTIINRIPQFQEVLDGQKTKDKNIILSRHFKNAYELLKTKTYAYTEYTNLKITENTPTVSMLKDNITITHTGRVKR